MKTTIKISMIALLATSTVYADSNMKKYDVKSAKIEYSIKSSGSMMGMTTEEIGKKRVIFDDYGVKELKEESKVHKTTGLGQNKVDKTHILNYMNNLIIYQVDFESKRVMRMKNQGAVMASMLGGGKNLKKTGEEMLKKMGGKKIGSDKVAGYKCDIWNLSGVKQCIYKGVPLRVESNIMGMKSTEVATKAEFGLSLGKDDFKLPDFPVYNMDSNYQKKPEPIDKSKLEEMDRRDNTKQEKENDEMGESLKAVGVGYAAAQKAGYDISSDKDMTPEQKEAMKKAMINAMGGEKAMLSKMKQQILEEMKNIPKAKKCFQNANSIKDANVCERMIDEEEPEVHNKWNSKIKSDLLKKIDEYEKSINCVKNAQKMELLESCFPEDD